MSLELPRRRQTDCATSNDSRGAHFSLEREFGREIAGTPPERMPGAAMTVVVNDGLVIESRDCDNESRRPVRSQTDSRPDDAIPRCIHRC